MKFDPFSPDFARDPYAVYQGLRSQAAPLYSEEFKLWFLSSYQQVSQIALHSAAVRSLDGFVSEAELRQKQREANWHDMPYHERVVQFSLLDSDGETHRRLRSLVFAHLTAKQMAKLMPALEAYLDQLIEQIAEQERFDFMAEFAQHIPGFLIGELLGMPLADRPQLRKWSDQIVQFFDLDRSDDKKQLAEAATEEFYFYIQEQLQAPSPEGCLLNVMLSDFHAGRYDKDELISTVMLILMAGHGSSIDMLGNVMHCLFTFPDVLRSLKQQKVIDQGAMQELFRFEPPLPFFHRYIVEDVELDGQNFAAGTNFGLLYASANRDESVFDQADQILLDRQPNRHLSFGRGAHLCLGNHLARLSIAQVFKQLFSRFDEFELLDEQVIFRPGLSVRGPQAMMVRFI